jgi:hypothetical protein
MSNIIIPESHKATHTPAPRAAGVESQLVDSPSITANEMVMARTVAEKLNKHYPGHLWAVAIEDGRLIIKNLYLSGEWGFVIRSPTSTASARWSKTSCALVESFSNATGNGAAR